MADDKKGRNKQADDRERRQRERELEEARDRADEAEPIDGKNEPVDDDPGRELGGFDEALANHEYPTTSSELITSYGDHEVETQEGHESIESVLASVDDETYDSADDVRTRIQDLIRRG